MKPVGFRYYTPGTVDDALAILAEAGMSGKALAGGQSLVPMMNFRLARPEVVVDLNRIPELSGIRIDGEAVVIGAMTRHQTIADSVQLREVFPLLPRAASHIGHWAVRNRGTIGGSLAHADPAAEWPAALQTADARVEVAGPRGRRRITIGELVVGPLTVSLEPEELIVAVHVPRPSKGMAFGFHELARRPGDFALVGAVVRVADGRADWTWFGLGHRPETRGVAGAKPGPALAGQLREVLADVPVTGDIHAGEAWRRQVAVTVAERALDDALGAHGTKEVG